jgi:hypothetical protein
MEESMEGHNTSTAIRKTATFTKYFSLQSVIIKKNISTDYDSLFLRKVKSDELLKENELEGDREIKNGKPGGFPYNDSTKKKTHTDTLVSKDTIISKDTLISADTSASQNESIAKSMFELAELFVYDLNRLDSAEYYLNRALMQSEDNIFKSKVMFALSGIYRNAGNSVKADDVLRDIVKEYPATDAANEARRLLGIQVTENSSTDAADSLFSAAGELLNSSRYRDALETYKLIPDRYPFSPNIMKAYYSAGWIYENSVYNNDSAYMYYSKVLTAEPNSELSKSISGKILEYMTYKENLNDSANTNKLNDSLNNLPKKDTLKSSTDSLQNIQKELIPKDPTGDGNDVKNPDGTIEPPVQKDIKKEEDQSGEEKK